MLDIIEPQGLNKKARRRTKKRLRQTSIQSIERGLHYFYVTQHVSRGDRSFIWPVLYLVHRDSAGETHVVRVESLLDYFEEHSAKQQQWRLNNVRGVGQLIEHSVEMLKYMSDEQRRAPDEPIERYLLRKFALNVVNGTTVVDKGIAKDALGLYWKPRAKEADRILANVSAYLTWLGKREEAERWAFAASVADVENTPLYAFRKAAELAIRKKVSLLSHIKQEGRAPRHRFAGITGKHSQSTNPVYAFPTRYVAPMMFEAFQAAEGEIDHEAELIALILLAGGLRSCEPFHLYVSDVQFLGDEPVVFLYHPEDSEIIYGRKKMSRRRYLQERFKLLPRTLQIGPGKAGWKSVLGDVDGTPVHWLPLDELQELLTQKLRRYILQIRPAIMRARPKHLGDHPFLFVNPRDATTSGGGNIGNPYTMSAFKGAWERAIRRLASLYDDPDLAVKKGAGTSLHGPRHFYGRFLRTLGVPPDIIQLAMHHKSILSQDVYTRLTSAEVSAFIKRSASQTDLAEMTIAVTSSVHKYRNHYMNSGASWK
jgi:integrase